MFLWVEAALLLTLAETLATYAVAAAMTRGAPPQKAGAATRLFWLLREWLYEIIFIAIAVFVWPADTLLRKNRRDAERPAVVIVHGLFCSPAHWLPLAYRLRRAGIANVVRPRYHGAGGLEEWSARLADGLRGHKGGIVFIGHSFGGLAAAHATALLPRGAVKRIITLGTPFEGTVMSYFGIAPAGRRLIPGTPYMRETDKVVAALETPFTCYWSRFDQLIVPGESARLAKAENIELEGMGHTGYLFSRDVADRLIALIRTETVA
ncbi:MAG: alpha/beta fold hydrolase [Candidatus Nitrosotenuis sp.]|nr:MAG: alpha/beta fold hydrolase [Candidatus Nitrosotenuis sp.]